MGYNVKAEVFNASFKTVFKSQTSYLQGTQLLTWKSQMGTRITTSTVQVETEICYSTWTATVLGSRWDPPVNAKGVGRGDCQDPFHHLSVFLVNWRGLEVCQRDSYLQRGL